MLKKKKKSLGVLVSQAIRRLRNLQGISQEELSDRSGLDRTYISAVERQRRNITIASLSRIVASLGLTEAEFLQELINQIGISEENADE